MNNEKYFAIYHGPELMAVGTYEQCNQYAIDRLLLDTQLVEVEPDWNNEEFMNEYYLSDEMYDMPVTEAEYNIITNIRYQKSMSRLNVLGGLDKILKEPRINQDIKQKYQELRKQVQELFDLEQESIKEDTLELIQTLDFKTLVKEAKTLINNKIMRGC